MNDIKGAEKVPFLFYFEQILFWGYPPFIKLNQIIIKKIT